MVKEFKDFILRGNVIDLAVAVVIGAAFGAVVTSFVASFITPLIAAIGGDPDFSALAFTINGSRFTYGSFFNALLAFLIIALVIFLVIVKPMNALQKRAAAKDQPGSDAPAEDIVLLTEIRDELRSRRTAA